MSKKKYKNIDKCPIGVFLDALDGTNLHKIDYFSVYQGFIHEFGLSQSVEEFYGLKLKIIELYRKAHSGQRHFFTLARVKEDELATMIADNGDGIKGVELIAYVAKGMGFAIDPNKTSIKTFYGYERHIKKTQT